MKGDYRQVVSILLTADVTLDVEYNKSAVNKSICVGKHKCDPFGAVEEAKKQWIGLASAENGVIDWLMETEYVGCHPDDVPDLPCENLRFKVAIELDYLSVGHCPECDIESLIQGEFPFLSFSNIRVGDPEVTVGIL